ncbi:MAG TPA: 1-phosphofructokinase family hexose kinase [Flavobacterium sp.]|nr:1-phosphofructokinase family hexose kinase [Flavobacterium sp.]
MKTFDILTLTVNPSLDKSTVFKGLVPEQKIRCESPVFDAGGGGINASKAIARLGGESLCVFTAGGATGKQLMELVAREQIISKVISVESETRENLIALDANTNAQYRFGFPGGALSLEEQQAIVATVGGLQSKFLVLSGSLNEGLPFDFYQKIAKLAKDQGSKLIVDTSGDALRAVLETGVYLAKPNIGELAKLVGSESLHADEADEAAHTLIEKGHAEIVVVSLGPQGAVLVSKNETHFVPAPNVAKKSTVGAGDSMVGGMVWALSQHKPLKEVVQWGVACGSAATMNEGTQLFKAEDARKLFGWLQKIAT